MTNVASINMSLVLAEIPGQNIPEGQIVMVDGIPFANLTLDSQGTAEDGLVFDITHKERQKYEDTVQDQKNIIEERDESMNTLLKTYKDLNGLY
jgi:hypothetical protein